MILRYAAIFFIFIIFPAAGQDDFFENLRTETDILMRTVEQNHYQPRVPDDQFSVSVYEKVLEELDPRRLYFTVQDIDRLTKYKTSIDDDLREGGWSFLSEVTAVYEASLHRSEKCIAAPLQNAFSLIEKTSPYCFNCPEWVAGMENHCSNWQRWLKYKVLERMYALKTFKSEEQSAFKWNLYADSLRGEVVKGELRSIRRLLNHPAGFRRSVADIFLKAIATTFDPHTTYMSPGELASFIASLSTEGYSFGLGLDENEIDEVVITYLVPGGPAWNSGELHTSDVLYSIRWSNGIVVDIHGLSAVEVDEILHQSMDDIAELTVKKASGLLKTVKLKKEKIALEENVVKSFLLKRNKTIGYISLAGFYSDWDEERQGNRCANDVAKEILKLKREGISGLILDLRFNGGGSLQEALEMAGIFIDYGALGVLSDRTGRRIRVRDNNRGTVYDGPLIVLVNRQSASASEFLAAALQDYNRAIIVGCETFGKATAQKVFSLNPQAITFEQALTMQGNFGFLNVTVNKIYRVTGKTVQGKGVMPDIVLPDLFDGIPGLHESYLPGFLAPDSVEQSAWFRPVSSLPLDELRVNSKARIENNNSFVTIRSFSSWLSGQFSTEPMYVSLTWPEYLTQQQADTEHYNALESLFERHSGNFTVLNHTSDLRRMQVDAFIADMNERMRRNISADVYVEEALNIMEDYVSMTGK